MSHFVIFVINKWRENFFPVRKGKVMRSISLDSGKLESYILGELSEQEQEVIEMLLFQSEGFFEQLLMIEEGLMEKYLFDENLSEEKRSKLASIYSTSQEYTEELHFLTTLQSIAAERIPSDESAKAKQKDILNTLTANFRDLLSLKNLEYKVVK
jgi:hypothetical protein